MKLRFRHLAILLVFLAPLISRSQTREPKQIDQYGKAGADELEARLENAAIQLQKNPGTYLEFVIHPAEAESPGLAYYTFGIQKGFLLAQKLNASRIISTFCDSQPAAEIQLWLIDSLDQRHRCTPDEINLASSTLFISSAVPNPLYEPGTCCLVDNLGGAGNIEALRAYIDVLQAHPEVGGGTNLISYTNSRNREQKVRYLDASTYVATLAANVRRRLLASKVGRPRFIVINGGYRGSYASIDLWIIPPGGKMPKPTPNYRPRSKRP